MKNSIFFRKSFSKVGGAFEFLKFHKPREMKAFIKSLLIVFQGFERKIKAFD